MEYCTGMELLANDMSAGVCCQQGLLLGPQHMQVEWWFNVTAT